MKVKTISGVSVSIYSVNSLIAGNYPVVGRLFDHHVLEEWTKRGMYDYPGSSDNMNLLMLKSF